MCAVSGRARRMGLSKPLGAQKITLQALDARHSTAGFDVFLMDFGFALVCAG